MLNFGSSGKVVLKFPTTDRRDQFLHHLDKAVSRRAWDNDPQELSSKPPPDVPGVGFKASGAGVGGIIRRRKEKHDQEIKLASTAMEGDLETLMVKAEEVVKVIERLKKRTKGGGAWSWTLSTSY